MAIAEAVSGFIQGAVKPVLDKFIPDAKDRLEAENMIFKMAHEIDLGQIEINKEEAKSSSLFVAGWRPFIGWVCGGSFAYAVIGNDLLNWVFALITGFSGHEFPKLPEPDTTLTLEILMAMLGLGGLRTWEKYKGVSRETHK